MLATCDRPVFDEDSIEEGLSGAVHPGPHPIGGLYGLMTSVPFGGNSLSWFREVMRPGADLRELDRAAAAVDTACEGLMFVPVSGSRSGRGGFVGIDGAHRFEHFVRAVYEGVALANRIRLDHMRAAGVDVKKLLMIGGGAKSAVWPRIVADACDVEVVLPGMKEAACAGAAVLAGMGCGMFSSPRDALSKMTGDALSVMPANDRCTSEMFERYLYYVNAL
jgi:xylulokinase